MDAVQRRDEVIAPAVIENKLATARNEFFEIRIHGFQNVVVVELLRQGNVTDGIEVLFFAIFERGLLPDENGTIVMKGNCPICISRVYPETARR